MASALRVSCSTLMHPSAEEKQRPALLRLADLLDGTRRPQDIVGGNAILLAGELISAARSAHAPEYALPHQGLQHGLQVPRRKVMAERE
jgi:hypothetical protein